MLTRRLFIESMGDEHALSCAARETLSGMQGAVPDTNYLADLASRGEVNLATRILYEYLLADSGHGEFIRQVDRMPVHPRQATSAPLLVIVPGMFYREYPEIGADGRLLTEIAAQYTIDTTVVPTRSLGSVAENVEILHEFLRELGGRPYCLISMSRGSAEVKLLMQVYSDAQYFDHLQSWISLCGITSGTPLHQGIYANRVLAAMHRMFARVNGINPQLGAELCRNNANWQPTQCPPSVKLINIIAVPLSWHITGSAMRRYRRIRHLGPSDGVVLLGDYLREPGLIYPVWGVDHFVRTSRIATLFHKLLHLMFLSQGESNEKSYVHNTANDCRDVHRDGAGSACG